MNAPNHSNDELRRLARAWFTEAQKKSIGDEAEVKSWCNERRKWSPVTGTYGGSTSSETGGFFSGSDCGGD